jgi:WXXGXW repeat (2 copies)
MKLHKYILLGVCAATSVVGMTLPTIARAEVNIYFRAPPPPVRVEVAPRPRRGYIWINGYWDVKHNRHVWRKGHWERHRVGYYYAQPTWVERNNRWELERGHWRRGDRDQDRDGIPNRYDRDRDGDGVSNRYDRDRDGDGVNNRRDRNDGPHRYDRDDDGIPNSRDRDRDGDGVSNRRDDAPDNPRRR